MKLRLTPLLIIACGLFLLGIYYIFCGSNLGPPVGVLVILFGGVVILLYKFFERIFRAKIGRQVIVEFLLIVLVIAGYYKINSKILLHIPRNFKGNILVIYNVDKAPKLQTKHFFSYTTDVEVPPSGILLTSSDSPNGYINKLVVVDSSQNKVTLFTPGYGIAFITDTLKFNNKIHTIDVLSKEELSHWKNKADSVKRILKMELGKPR